MGHMRQIHRIGYFEGRKTLLHGDALSKLQALEGHTLLVWTSLCLFSELGGLEAWNPGHWDEKKQREVMVT